MQSAQPLLPLSFEKASAAAAPFVLAFGDSLTAGYGLAREEAFPARLQALLRLSLSGAVVHNAGVSGDTTRSALARLPRLLSSLNRRPDLAIVELGANDLIRRIDPSKARSNLDAIVRELQRCSIPTLLASVEPPAFLGAIARAYSGIHADIGQRHGISVHPFFPPGVLGHHAHVLRDRLHPNAVAIDKVARAMLRTVLEQLAVAPTIEDGRSESAATRSNHVCYCRPHGGGHGRRQDSPRAAGQLAHRDGRRRHRRIQG